MTLQNILQYAHKLMSENIREGDTVIDATCGNGHDTVFLSKLVGKRGHVYAFDVQRKAIQNTRNRLDALQYTNVSLIRDTHGNCIHHIPLDRLSWLSGAIFNLGYLPGSDKTVVTQSDSTIQAVEAILTHLRTNGIVVLVIYHGHEEGKTEMAAVMEYARLLDQQMYNVLYYGFINQENNPPFIIGIEKR